MTPRVAIGQVESKLEKGAAEATPVVDDNGDT